MSHQRYPSIDPIKEPHSISLKVLRLSRPSLVTQYPISPPLSPEPNPPPIPASLAYPPPPASSSPPDRNPSAYLLSPILKLPVSFGSAYVGETFSCTLCANNDLPPPDPAQPASTRLHIRDVKIGAEMKTPGMGAVQKLDDKDDAAGVDLESGGTFQRVVNFDLKEEGNHVLAVTISYYEATGTSGRTRTFRKLYQFICKASLIVRTKVGSLEVTPPTTQGTRGRRRRRWALEAQLENCSEDAMQLEKVAMELERGFRYRDCNWETSRSEKPILHPGEVEQVCFVVEEEDEEEDEEEEEEEETKEEGEGSEDVVEATSDGRVIFGVLGIGWRGQMGNRGFLSTGKLGARVKR